MDQDVKQILDKQTKLLEENIDITKKIRRAQVFGSVTWILKWIIILGIGFGSYYYFQPAISRFFEVYDKILLNVQGVPEFLENVRN